LPAGRSRCSRRCCTRRARPAEQHADDGGNERSVSGGTTSCGKPPKRCAAHRREPGTCRWSLLAGGKRTHGPDFVRRVRSPVGRPISCDAGDAPGRVARRSGCRLTGGDS
jgi:hypothetical protein